MKHFATPDLAHEIPIAKRHFAEGQSRQLELLALRSFQLADRVASGELQFLDAVDVAFDAAVASGLAEAVGYDVIQAVLATAFERVRP
jgi:hypothetical protein